MHARYNPRVETLKVAFLRPRRFAMLLMGGRGCGGTVLARFLHSSPVVLCHPWSVAALSCKCCAALVLLEQDTGCCISLEYVDGFLQTGFVNFAFQGLGK